MYYEVCIHISYLIYSPGKGTGQHSTARRITMKKKEIAKQFKYPVTENQSESLRTVVAERGQVTIPKKLRDKLGLLPGTPIVWRLKDNNIYLSKDNDEDIKARIAKVYGCLKDSFPYASTDGYINEIRGPVE